MSPPAAENIDTGSCQLNDSTGVVSLSEFSLYDILAPLHTEGRTWSTGSFIFQHDGMRMLFAGVQKPNFLRVMAIGGRRESGETLLQALLREGKEEARIQLQPQDAARTCFLLDDQITQMTVLPREIEPRPAMVWTGVLQLSSHRFDYGCAVWRCDFTGTPEPSAEIDCLLLMKPKNISCGRSDQVEFVGSSHPPADQIVAIGSAARAPVWLKTQKTVPQSRLSEALRQGRELLLGYDADEKLLRHSEQVAAVALSIGERLAAAGHMIDPADFLLAGLCHDIGRTRQATRAAAESDHASTSATILRQQGWPDIAPLVRNHSLDSIFDDKVGDAPGQRALFYADKAVQWCEIGTEPRFDAPPRYITHDPSDYQTARQKLAKLEHNLAADAGLSIPHLRQISYLAAISERPVR